MADDINEDIDQDEEMDYSDDQVFFKNQKKIFSKFLRMIGKC